MKPFLHLLTQAPPLTNREAPVRSSFEEQVRAQAKAQKKERKAERLRFFFGWCESCRVFGEVF